MLNNLILLAYFLTALLPKPQRSYPYAFVCETALSENYSAPDIKVFSAGYANLENASISSQKEGIICGK